jgi:hypothetical protein
MAEHADGHHGTWNMSEHSYCQETAEIRRVIVSS